MTNTNKNVWDVKYALTQGIYKLKEPRRGQFGGNYWICGIRYVSDKNAAYTPEEALEKAEAMRKKKIENLKKQIKKLEAMKFEVPNE